MNELDFREPIVPFDNVKQTELGANDAVSNPDASTGKVVVEAALKQDAPTGETITHETAVGTNAGLPPALLDREEAEALRTRWNEIQAKFVDEPRSAVQQADELVSEVVKKIIKIFASEHSSLEGQWNQGIDVSTEDLRKALQHYRSFFNRLVV